MFEWSKTIMNKIENKENLTKNELLTIERLLRMEEISESIMNYQLGIDENNTYELTRKCYEGSRNDA